MQTEIYNTKNEKVGTMDLPEGVFGVPWNADLVHQVIVAQRANLRAPLAHTKERGDVRGGGKKPWRQKGTGRARHGSRRSPLWSGGGITFGPRKDRIYSQKINKKMKINALFSVLSRKLKENNIKIIDEFETNTHKTKGFADMRMAVCSKKEGVKVMPRTLMIAKSGARNVVLAGRNIPRNSVSLSDSVNVYDCIASQCVIFEKPALEEFIERYQK